MMKRSLFLPLAAALIASFAFSAPCQAGSTLITTTEFFALSPASASATAMDFTYVDSTNAAVAQLMNLKILNMGGLAGFSANIVGQNDVHITFSDSAGTTGTGGINPTPGVEFTVTTANAPNNIFLSNGAPSLTFTGATGVSNDAKITLSAVPEPASLALLGIGMTGFLAFRRFFKKTSVA